MAYTLSKFLFCLELQLGGIILGWWGMISSAIGIVGVLLGLIFGERYYNTLFPIHFSTGGALAGGILTILFLGVYFYFSYKLLQGANSSNGSLMFGYLVMQGIIVVLFILAVISSHGTSLLLAIIYAYLWYCVYSLYVACNGGGIV